MKVASWIASRIGHGVQRGDTYVKTATDAPRSTRARGAARARRGTSAAGTPIVAAVVVERARPLRGGHQRRDLVAVGRGGRQRRDERGRVARVAGVARRVLPHHVAVHRGQRHAAASR